MWRRKWFWGLCLGGLVLACCWRSLSLLLDPNRLLTYFDAIGTGVVGVSVFVLAHVLATCIGVPGTVLVVVGGAVFGLVWGTLWSLIGATLGAIAAFILARTLLHDWAVRRFGHRPLFQKINTVACDDALPCVLMVRFAPISPFNLVNFLFGLTKVPLSAYSLGTFIGITPGTMAYTWLGVTGVEALRGDGMEHLLLCLSILAVMSALPLLLKRYAKG
ncbi:MAG: TVP38/TMEM64 family protein [Cyanobacteria bacterium J06632_22]